MTPHLAVPLVPPPPTLILIAALLLPYGIAYLAHLPRTRLVRIGVYPLSLVCGLWVALAVEHPKLKLDDETAPSVLGVGSVGSSEARGLAAIKAMRIVETMASSPSLRMLPHIMDPADGATSDHHIGAATRYAFTTLPPVPHPLPRQPPFPRLRSTTAFRALDLLLNEYRHINLASSSPLQPSLRTYRQSLLYHLRCAVFHLLLIDLFSYPFFRVAPNTIGSPFHVGGEYYPIRADIAGALGVPELVVQIGATACLGLVTYHGIGSMWHISAILGIGSGVWVDEEWVELMDRPWMATSLSELWGKRYHQLMRDFFLLVTSPLSTLPAPFRLMAIFLSSALFHASIFSPLTHSLALRPYLSFFLLCGLGVLGERTFRWVSGRRVEGWAGRIWTWSWMVFAGTELVAHEYGAGWAGAMRGIFGQIRATSAVEWAVYALGLGRSPLGP